jgi:hypothetical protein
MNTNTSQLMLCTEITPACSEIRKKTNSLWDQYVEILKFISVVGKIVSGLFLNKVSPR